MSKVKCIIEMDEDEYKRVKNAECSYDGFEKGTFGYYLNIIQKTATPIVESDDVISRQEVNKISNKVWNYLSGAYNPYDPDQTEMVKNVDKYIKELDRLPSVIPKCNPNKNVKTHYFHDDDYCPKESEATE